MKLHEAIYEAITKLGKPSTGMELANYINAHKLYVKRNGGAVKANQVAATINGYPNLFHKSLNWLSVVYDLAGDHVEPETDKKVLSETFADRTLDLQRTKAIDYSNENGVEAAMQKYPEHAEVILKYVGKTSSAYTADENSEMLKRLGF